MYLETKGGNISLPQKLIKQITLENFSFYHRKRKIASLLFLLMGFIAFSQTQIGGAIYGQFQEELSGSAVDVSDSGTRVIVGSPWYTFNGLRINAGLARVYELENGAWVQIGQTLEGVVTDDRGGYAVSISGDGTRVAVGYPQINTSLGAGFIRVFEYNSETDFWDLVGLPIDGEVDSDEFGISVSLNNDGTRVAAGAWENDPDGDDITGVTAGHVRVFEQSGNSWVQMGADIDGKENGERTGVSVSLNPVGDYVVVGGYLSDNPTTGENNNGVVRIYQYNGSSWVQVGADIFGEQAEIQSGYSVSINNDGTIVAVGQPYGNRTTGDGTGRAIVYQYNGSSWNQLGGNMDGTNPVDEFGTSVSISGSGTVVAVGGRLHDGSSGYDSGHVKVFKYIAPNWIEIAEIVGDDSQDFAGTSVNISGDANTLIIGAPNNDQGGGLIENYGQAKVFDLSIDPTIITNTATTVTALTMDLGGEVTNEGAFTVTERGVVYSSTNTKPTIGGANVIQDPNGSGLGTFSETITGLSPNTLYYYRAYATTSNGTAYGDILNVTTLTISPFLGEFLGDQYGYSVAINADGTRFIAGARNNDNASGTDAGHARVYELNNGVWTQLGANINGEAENDLSGSSVSISNDGTRVAIGSHLNDGIGTDSGSVRIYEYNSTTNSWDQVGGDIDGEVAGDFSAYSISLNSNGTRIAIGAYSNDGNGTDSGHTRIFEESGGVWTQLGADIDGEDTGDASGFSVSLNDAGDYIAIGAINNDATGSDAGQVRIFRYIDGITTWTQVGADIDAAAAGDQFGFSVSINSDGSIVAVGARRNDSAGTDSGHVRVYQYSGGSWQQLGSDINGENPGEWFGYSVSISADGMYLVGASYRNNSSTGKARIFKYNSTTSIWDQQGADIVGDNTDDALGFSVSISGNSNTVILGVPNNDTNGDNAGQVKLVTNSVSPMVTTSAATSITLYSASIGGEVTNEGQNMIERGVIYSATTTNPTIGGTNVIKDTNGNGLGVFSEVISGLTANTLYYYRAYAIDSNETKYGQVMSFVTCKQPYFDGDLFGEGGGDQLGIAVAVNSDGTRLIAGARYNDNASGTDAGHARVYELNNGIWTQLGGDIDGEAADDLSGSSVSISGDGTRVAIGSHLNDGIGVNSGSVRIYEYNSTTNSWDQVGSDIDGEATGDFSAYSISLNSNGTRVAIGAYSNDGNGTDSGHARIFEESGGVWTQLGADINGEAAGDHSGFSVGLNAIGDYVVIGAVNNDASGSNAGHVRIYNYNGSSWVQVGADIDGAAAGDQFGFSVSINSDGSIVAVGARRNDSAGTHSGHVRVYQYTGGSWQRLGSDINGENPGNSFGYSVSISSDGTYLIGAGYTYNSSIGLARIYKFESGDWQQIGGDIVGDNTSDALGFSVSISGNTRTIAIGVPNDDTSGTDAGKVKIYMLPIKPIVNTHAATLITPSTINIGGEVIDQGSFNVTERGVVYSLSNTIPTLGGTGVIQDINGNGLGTFSKTITGLIPNTLYYYRAYATNSDGTSYGEVMTVTTTTHPNDDLFGEGEGDQLGIAVAVNTDGTRVIAGARYNDNASGTNAGHARVYELNNGIWTQLGGDIDGEAANDLSGSSVSISGDGTRVAIGSHLNDGIGIDAGSVRIYEYNSTTNSWDQVGSDIDGAVAGDFSAYSISLNSNGTRIAIGAYSNDGNGTNSGHTRIFEESGGVWTQLGADIDGETAGDQSGFSVSLNAIGDYVVIGAVNNDASGSNAGHARIYNYNGSSWVQVGADIDGAAAGDQLGFSVSINSDGTIVAVGARRNDSAGTNSGHVRVYQYSGGSWNQLGSDINGENPGNSFGYSVSISSDGTYLIGAGYTYNSSIGLARIYKFESGDWQQIGGDIVGDNTSDALGFSVSISGNASVAVIGVPNDDTNGTDAGEVRVYSIFPQSIQVTTDDPISIASNYAYLGGEVLNSGVSNVTERGILYSSVNTDPFIGGSDVTKVANGSGTGSFTQKNYSLNPETIYYVKAYAINSEGTSYGEVKSFLSGLPIQIGQEITGSNNEDRYGQSIVLNSNGTVMVVGAPKNDTNGTDTGQVTIYELVVDEWMQKGNVLNGSSIQEAVGYSVSINDAGTIVAVATKGSTTQGHVSVYEYNSGGNIWNQKGSNIIVNSSVVVKLDSLGTKLILAYDDTNNGDLSAISTYEFNGSDWVQFGNTVNGINTLHIDISNDGSKIVGAFMGTTSSNGNNSFVRVYEYNSGNLTWEQLGSDLEESISDADFGTSLSLNGDGTIAAVTAYTSKQVYIYQFANGTWTQLGSAISSTDTIESIQLDDAGEFLAVGYNNDTDNKGYIRTYNLSGNTTWIQTNSSIYGKSTDDLFGKSITISGDGSAFAAGAPSQLSTAKGTVRIFQVLGVPVVVTEPITSITGTSANFEGNVTSGAGSTVTERGFVYSKSNEEPVIGGNRVTQIVSGSGLGSYCMTNTELYFFTTYYVRAYAINEKGIGYGETRSFTTNHDLFNILHTTGVWEQDDNKWSYTRPPNILGGENALIAVGQTGTIITTSGNKNIDKIIVSQGAKLIIEGGNSLTTNESLDIEGNATLEIESGGSLIVNGTSTGNITYKRYLPEDNWYMISPPVEGETFGSFVGNNNIDNGNGYIGLISYHNDGGGYNNTGWEFYGYPLSTTDSARILETGKGYAVRLPQADTIRFTGTVRTSDIVDLPTPAGATENSYLIGNPYPAYLGANGLTGENSLLGLNQSNLAESSLWIWDNTAYEYIAISLSSSTPRYIAPGQGFFIRTETDLFQFKQDEQTHQTDVYNRTSQSSISTRPEIKLYVDDGTRKRSTDIFYMEGTTTAFDNGYDASMFTILPDVSEIFTHTVSDSEGKHLAIQSLPDSNYEEMVVPIGISAQAGKELVFTATAVNFPNEIHVYLEDKETETFKRLDEVGAEYRVVLTENLTTVGRFYLHTNTEDVLSVNSLDTENISIYLKDKDLLNVTGIYNQESKLKVYSIQGKEVFTTRFRGTGLNEIRLPKLSSGIYIVRLETESGRMNKKIVLH